MVSITCFVTTNNATGTTETIRRAAMLSTTTSGAHDHTIFITGGTLRSALKRSLHFASGFGFFTASFSSMTVSTRPHLLFLCRDHGIHDRSRIAIQHARYHFLTMPKPFKCMEILRSGCSADVPFFTAGSNFYLEEKGKAFAKVENHFRR